MPAVGCYRQSEVERDGAVPLGTVDDFAANTNVVRLRDEFGFDGTPIRLIFRERASDRAGRPTGGSNASRAPIPDGDPVPFHDDRNLASAAGVLQHAGKRAGIGLDVFGLIPHDQHIADDHAAIQSDSGRGKR